MAYGLMQMGVPTHVLLTSIKLFTVTRVTDMDCLSSYCKKESMGTLSISTKHVKFYFTHCTNNYVPYMAAIGFSQINMSG